MTKLARAGRGKAFLVSLLLAAVWSCSNTAGDGAGVSDAPDDGAGARSTPDDPLMSGGVGGNVPDANGPRGASGQKSDGVDPSGAGGELMAGVPGMGGPAGSPPSGGTSMVGSPNEDAGSGGQPDEAANEDAFPLQPSFACADPNAARVKSLSAGGAHTCAVLQSGGLRCWGANNASQLGDRYNVSHAFTPDMWTSPPIEDITTNVAAASAGYSDTCALALNGDLNCWGASPYSTWLLTNTVLTKVAEVSVGRYHTCALMKTGGVRCWGENGHGQLGSGDTTDTKWPGQQNVIEDVAHVAVGSAHTCALLKTGSVSCWGAGSAAGSSSGDDQVSPRDMGLTSVTAIASGGDHTCALLAHGRVRCWGQNASEQLGEPSARASRFEAGPELLSDVGAITAGDGYTCALSKGGAVYCWGANNLGQLGRGIASVSELPSQVPVLTGAAAIDAGGAHACALLDDGRMRCWGANDSGQLGDGSRVLRASPVQPRSFCSPVAAVDALQEPERVCASGAALTVKQLAVGWKYNCALLSSDAVRCWGDNTNGVLGDGTRKARALPGKDVLLGVKELSAGALHICALMKTGGLRCWGGNNHGQLGDGTIADRLTPPEVDGLANVQSVAAGMFHTCAIVAGQVRCWGSNEGGAVGDGSKPYPDSFRVTPSEPLRDTEGATAIAAGEAISCALVNQQPRCWGRSWGYSGAVAKPLVNGSVRGLALEYDTCFVLDSNGVSCDSDISGDPLTNVRDLTLSASGSHCVLLQTGAVHCWGNNTWGSLGDSTQNTRYDLGPPILLKAVAIDGMMGHTCALLANGQLRCWGLNTQGQLGDGTQTNRPYPIPGPTFCP